ncbi:MAG: SDR family oxidoreductase [Bryobacteraceae bacterium]
MRPAWRWRPTARRSACITRPARRKPPRWWKRSAAATEAGPLGFTFSLAKEAGEHGITVNLVAPRRIRTGMLLERSAGREEEWIGQTPLRPFGEPEEIASAIVFLASPAAGYITGATLHGNGGLVMD